MYIIYIYILIYKYYIFASALSMHINIYTFLKKDQKTEK
jgi:hypothetical protein